MVVMGLDARSVDFDDTPIPMNETISSDKETDIDQPTTPDQKKEVAKNGKPHTHGPPTAKEIQDHQLHLQKARFCNTCQVERPPFASHCSSCGHCTRGFDHHCMVTNCCIAERNLRNFVLLQFFVGCCAFAALIVVPLYYYEHLSELPEENLKYFEEYKWKLILWHLLGYLCMGLTLVGAIPC